MRNPPPLTQTVLRLFASKDEMEKYSYKKVGDDYAVLRDGQQLWLADLATARRDAREFNKAVEQGVQSDGAPLFWWCKCLNPNYQTSENCEFCGLPRS